MLSKGFRSLAGVLLLISSCVTPTVAQDSITTGLSTSFNVLQDWYNNSNGLWNTAGWWNAANVLTMLGDYAAVDSSVKSSVEKIYVNTFVQAQKYDLKVFKAQQSNSLLPVSLYSDPLRGSLLSIGGLTLPDFPSAFPFAASTTTTFTDDYYDDDGWWALAWIRAYDVTGNSTYLSAAEDIFNTMQNGLNSPCSSGGAGIYWSTTSTYVNAIANELFLSVAAHLANRATGTSQQTYLNQALEQWTWFQNSGMINSQNLINDGLTNNCTNNGQTTWTYNQGVILGALVELNKADSNSSYITQAKAIASAAISQLAVKGILHETCEPNCGADGTQFKGVFMRNLGILNTASPETAYTTFINNNANSILSNNDNSGKLSVSWAGPFVATANASTQSSAMDALVAAVGVSKGIASRKPRSARLVYSD